VSAANPGFAKRRGRAGVRFAHPSLRPRREAGARAPAHATAAKQEAKSWIQAGTRAVLVVDATQNTVSVYRAPDVAGQGGFLDLSDVVPGWSLRVDDLLE
jgi:hypothetical protein